MSATTLQAWLTDANASTSQTLFIASAMSGASQPCDMMWERVIGGIASAAEASGTNGGGGKDAMDEMAICGTEPGVQVFVVSSQVKLSVVRAQRALKRLFTFTFTLNSHLGKTHDHRSRGDTPWRAQTTKAAVGLARPVHQ